MLTALDNAISLETSFGLYSLNEQQWLNYSITNGAIYGITQEQLTEIFEVKWETITIIIKNQLRVKFLLPSVSTKLIVKMRYGFPFSIPELLRRPSVIVLEDRLAD